MENIENKKGMVKIPLNEYLKLYELEKNLKEKVIRYSEYNDSQHLQNRKEINLTYLTPDETINKLEKIIEKQKENIETLEYRIISLEHKEINVVDKLRDDINNITIQKDRLFNTLKKVSKMSIFGFRKWRKIMKKIGAYEEK